MAHVQHRCELHFSIRAPAANLDLNLVSAFCANLATYPYANGTFYDWTQTINSPGEIPRFPGCSTVLLHPAFNVGGWDTMIFEGTKIQIMNLVPLTLEEMAFRQKNGPFSIYDYLSEKEIDIFRDRGD